MNFDGIPSYGLDVATRDEVNIDVRNDHRAADAHNEHTTHSSVGEVGCTKGFRHKNVWYRKQPRCCKQCYNSRHRFGAGVTEGVFDGEMTVCCCQKNVEEEFHKETTMDKINDLR